MAAAATPGPWAFHLFLFPGLVISFFFLLLRFPFPIRWKFRPFGFDLLPLLFDFAVVVVVVVEEERGLKGAAEPRPGPCGTVSFCLKKKKKMENNHSSSQRQNMHLFKKEVEKKKEFNSST